MRLTRAGEYAGRCVLYMSIQEEKIVGSRNEIARTMDIPNQFRSYFNMALGRRKVREKGFKSMWHDSSTA